MIIAAELVGPGAPPSARRASGRPTKPTAALALLLALLLPGLARAEVELRAFIDRNDVAVGQAATLTVEIQGAQDVPAPAFGAPDGLTVRYVGPATQMNFVNGQVSASVSHRYALIPTREGAFTLGPFSIEYGGRKITTGAITLRAVPAERAAEKVPGRDEIKLFVGTPRKRVYVQEPLPLTLTLVVGAVRVDDLQYPTVAAEGFTIERFAEPKQTREVRDGRQVTVLRFETTIVPLRPGTINIGPAHAQMSVLVGAGRRGGDPFFGGIFGEYRKEPIDVASEAVPLEVLQLPEAGRPPDFRGAIGRFTLEVTAKPAELRVGDPVTVHATIRGQGNFNAIGPPAIEAGADFKTYAPQELGSPSPGQKNFEQVLIPLRAEVRQVPPVSFSFFNTESGQYETLRQGPFPLTVRPAEEAQEARVVQAQPEGRAASRSPEKLGRDLVYIKDAPGSLAPRRQTFLSRAWFWIGMALPTLAYAALWLRVRQRDRLRSDPRYARFARAGREATSALAAARRLLQGGEETRFDDALSRAVREYLAAKLDLPPGAVEAENVARRLGANGGPAELATRVERVLSILERVRYAPTAAARADREESLRLAEEIVAALEKRRYSAAAASAALVLIALAACVPARAADNPVAAFYEGNSLYGKGQFEDAARAYEGVLAAGRESAAVYYNLGNAYMKSGKPGLAILNYERARRLAPSDADILTNLSFALEERKIASEEPLWRRLVFPLAERASSGALAAVCVTLWAGLLLALAVRLLSARLRTPAMRAAAALAVLLLFAGANLGCRMSFYDLADDAVVTRSGQTPVRFEPNADGTTHFSVVEGTLLHVLESRDGWLQVARADGRRGWIEAAACERL